MPTEMPHLVCNRPDGVKVNAMATSPIEATWKTNELGDAMAQGLSPAALGEVVYRRSASLGTRLGVRRSDVLLHVCTHAHYTAAQVVNMLRQLGAELPQTMLIMLSRNEQGV